MMDYLGHEGSKAPVSCGVVIAADNGWVFRAEYTVQLRSSPEDLSRWVWRNQSLARVGPQLRSDLMRALAGEELDEEAKVRLFGEGYEEILGTPEELSEARRMIEKISPAGDDAWVTVEG